MGVKGLWPLLLPIGRRINLETLEGQVLAVDASIWLTQMLKAMRDPATGKVLPAAHLIGFVRRLCRLYFHGIKPVFVFDGPTPAIKKRETAERRKRREQFQQMDQAAVQRLAKRLLAENLKKQAKNKSPSKKKPPPSSSTEEPNTTTITNAATVGGAASGFVDGFYLPGQEEEEEEQEEGNEQDKSRGTPSAQATITLDTSNKRGESGACAATAISLDANDPDNSPRATTSQEDEAAILAAIQQDLLEADENDRKNKEPEVNDFDAPIEIDLAHNQDDDSNQDDEQEPDSNPDSQSKGLKRYFNTSRRKKNGTLYKGDCQDVAYISKLDSTERKDAIEEAKRQQRLQSRRQYMPAAANPDKFSTVQLDNFLKSSRFNLNVQKMATQKVVSGSQPAKTLKNKASHESKQELSSSAVYQSVPMASDLNTRISLIREEKRASAVQNIQTDQRATSHTSAKTQTTTKANLEEDSDSEVEWEDADMPRVERAVVDSEDEEEIDNTMPLQQGGFITIEEPNGSTDDPTNWDNDSESGGGFLPEDHGGEASLQGTMEQQQFVAGNSQEGSARAIKHGNKNNLIVLKDDSSVESDGKVAANTGRLESQQEQRDREYAMALQEMEDAQAAQQFARSSPSSSVSSNKAVLGGSDLSDAECAMSETEWKEGEVAKAMSDDDKKPAAKPTAKPAAEFPVGDCDEEEEDVDWEDGEEESISNFEQGETRHLNASGDEATGLTFDGNQEHGNTDSFLDSTATVPKAQPIFTSESTSDTSYNNQTVPSEISQDHHTVSERSTNSMEGDWDTKSPSKETEEVLQRAQATASSLADWAGRAFRRAMKDANREAGQRSLGNDKDDLQMVDSNKDEVQMVDLTAKDVSEAVSPSQPPTLDLSDETSLNDVTQSTIIQAVPSVAEGARKGNGEKLTSSVGEENLPNQDFEITDDILKQWESERNQRERDADTVTDEMKEEVIVLLRLFGVPYIEAPAEAEAQCAALEALGLVDGIVTEDSDVFVFGGRKVYKNIFEEKRFAEAYMSSDAEKEMGLNRSGMVALAMLLGSDYTRGVRGVGIVNAMEIIQAFAVSADLKRGLTRFGAWLEGFGTGRESSLDGSDVENRFKEEHKTARARWALPSNFPAQPVIQAYMNPVVDKSKDRFTWGAPDVEGLVMFCAKHIGWPADETKTILEPVVARRKERYTQTRLDSFMKYEDGIKFANVKSKRLRAVLGQVESQQDKKKKKKNE